ncbi:hypothetical protein [Flavobacterium macrobrachii]|uniref:ABC transporter permease n=1 Tax=Flavobacterium macrobrachii TaxID=591204 RepID=A0ABS2CTS9_9FLAO|nr:hypothetical protein [Flavobacterium macrobrachii]MBM6498296.1 hypothetical protein [Flavobacterium macrobrachii]
MNQYFSVFYADFLQRVRSNSFIVLLIISVVAAYKFVPLPQDHYTTVRIGDYTGLNNAAWIGHSTAIMACFFLWLFGFYVVNNSIRNDLQTGVGQLIASSAITNFQYLLAKAVSHFFLFSIIVVVVFLFALGLTFYRVENYPFDFFQFASPYFFVTFPSVFILSALTIFFEVVFVQKTNIMNLIFILLFIGLLGVTNTLSGNFIYWIDPLGIQFLLNEISMAIPKGLISNSQEISVGINYNADSNLNYFLFKGSHFSFEFYLSRLFWIIFSLVTIKISSVYFHRFDVKTKRVLPKRQHVKHLYKEAIYERKIYFERLQKVDIDYRLFPLIFAEFLLLIRKGSIRLWILNLGCFIGLFFIPIEDALFIGLPIIWYLQVNRWSDLFTKEQEYKTASFIYSTYKPLKRLLLSQFLAGTILALIFALPVIVRLCLLQQFLEIIQVILSAISILSFSFFSGILFSGKRFFEFVFLFITFICISSGRTVSYIIWSSDFKHNITFQVLFTSLLIILSFSLKKMRLNRD